MRELCQFYRLKYSTPGGNLGQLGAGADRQVGVTFPALSGEENSSLQANSRSPVRSRELSSGVMSCGTAAGTGEPRARPWCPPGAPCDLQPCCGAAEKVPSP